ncbi:glycosyltransferase family 2 protein [Enterococcus sp. HY326]|uniref:glycosyltransferase family 2 protein n=1 Tax=Enterococcus sp. HY326 TaxID=2971265 RepID=UPI00223FF3CE|nr:glycosyltransferase family 2 protein [Enterococcus sp. HY326]
MKKMKRQIGTERDMTPLSCKHKHASTAKLTMNRIYIIITILFWIIYITSTIFNQFIYNDLRSLQSVLEAILYMVIVTLLNFSAVIYLFSREGALKRFNEHTRTPREKLDDYFSDNQSKITVLVPSYDEEVSVIKKTILSAALQEYPEIDVVLLIDDKVHPDSPEAIEKLEATKAIAADLNKLLSEPAKRFKQAVKEFEKEHKKSKVVKCHVLKKLGEQYEWAANWLNQLADSEAIEDHVDVFFADQVLRDLAKELMMTSEAISTAVEQEAAITYKRGQQLFKRLAWIFTVNISYFQRKKYVSLSHEANKAMNLNSYIDLMGGNYQIIQTPIGEVLKPTENRKAADLIIPDSEYLLTLDADSILLREYCLRLVYLLNQPGNERIAVAQTPYSSFRGTPTRIERIAGATTDIQHILHQGSTYYNATFWVGANAVIRKRALEDIAETEMVHGFTVRRFIQDRTVIEDTESSVDLGRKGWSLINYPERLSYSATPPDFGSLIIQRRRWANGGLLILPKLFAAKKQRKQDGNPMKLMELCIRMNYMASVCWASFGLIFLLVYPFDSALLSVFIFFSAISYFVAMSSDLKLLRYKRTDIFRVYGFNLLLLAVNLAGVIKSVQQALTSEKIPFARTPKVNDRTASPSLYIIAPLAIIGFSIFTCYQSYQAGNYPNALFAGFNAITATWATISYIGIGNMLVDLAHNLISWLFVEKKSKCQKEEESQAGIDWQSVLYFGSTDEKVPLGLTLNTMAAEDQRTNVRKGR